MQHKAEIPWEQFSRSILVGIASLYRAYSTVALHALSREDAMRMSLGLEPLGLEPALCIYR